MALYMYQAVFPNKVKIMLDSRSCKLETFTRPKEISPDSRWSMADSHLVRPKKLQRCQNVRPTSVLPDKSGRSDVSGKDWPSTPHYGFSVVSLDGNCAYVHRGSFTSNSKSALKTSHLIYVVLWAPRVYRAPGSPRWSPILLWTGRDIAKLQW